MRTSEAQWRARVREWRASGLSARQFAEQLGVSPSTLTYWGWRLRKVAPKPQVGRGRAKRPSQVPAVSFVELRAGSAPDRHFELDLGNGRCLRIPAEFDPAALGRLLSVLEGQGNDSR